MLVILALAAIAAGQAPAGGRRSAWYHRLSRADLSCRTIG
jgi:hypothetical protein